MIDVHLQYKVQVLTENHDKLNNETIEVFQSRQ